MSFRNYLQESANAYTSIVAKEITGNSYIGLKSMMKNFWDQFAEEVVQAGKEQEALRYINKFLGTHYTSMNQIGQMRVSESYQLNESFREWVDKVKNMGLSSFQIFATLQIFFELEKLLGSRPDTDLKKMIVYVVLWLISISGKEIAGLMSKMGSKWSHPVDTIGSGEEKGHISLVGVSR